LEYQSITMQLAQFSVVQETEYDAPLQTLLAAIVTSLRSNTTGSKQSEQPLTAVSSIDLSPGSTLPPGNDVSPAYVLSVDERLS
jgi:hypothetical protein